MIWYRQGFFFTSYSCKVCIYVNKLAFANNLVPQFSYQGLYEKEKRFKYVG